jgi:type II secretory pathway pseudopilin PulG
MQSNIAYAQERQYKNQLILTAVTIFVAVVSAITVSAILVSAMVRGEVAQAITNNSNANGNSSAQQQTASTSNAQAAFTCSELMEQMKVKDGGDAFNAANGQVVYRWLTPPVANNAYTYNTTNTENWDISGKVKDSFNVKDSNNVKTEDSYNNTSVNKVIDSNNNTAVTETEDSNNSKTITNTEDSNNVETEDSNNPETVTVDKSITTDNSDTLTLGNVEVKVEVE